MSYEHFTGPLSKLNDGYIDITLARRENLGRIGLASLLLSMDNGEYFTDEGQCNEDIGIEYYKV